MIRPNVFHGTYSMIWANSVLPTFMGPLGLYKPKSIAKEQNGFQIVDTPKTAKHPVVIGFFAIDHERNRTLLLVNLG